MVPVTSVQSQLMEVCDTELLVNPVGWAGGYAAVPTPGLIDVFVKETPDTPTSL